MAIQKTEAFVLNAMPFRSSSLIITFFTKSFGKLKGIAKGVRKERETRGAMFELFTHLEIVFYEKQRSDLHLISDSAILDTYDSIRTKLNAIVYGSYYAELVDRLTEVHDPHQGIYDLLDFSYRFLTSVPPEKLSRLFEIKLLNEIGWLPHFTACLDCQTTQLKKAFFSIPHGAVYCPECVDRHPEAKQISEPALDILRYYVGHPLEQSIKHPMPLGIKDELEKLMAEFIDYRLDAPLNTRRFISQIKPAILAN